VPYVNPVAFVEEEASVGGPVESVDQHQMDCPCSGPPCFIIGKPVECGKRGQMRRVMTNDRW